MQTEKYLSTLLMRQGFYICKYSLWLWELSSPDPFNSPPAPTHHSSCQTPPYTYTLYSRLPANRGMCQSSYFCDWRYILYKCVFVSLLSPYTEINQYFLFAYVLLQTEIDLNFIYCILRTLQVEAEVPFLEEDESPPVKRHCKFFYTDFTSPLPDEFSGSFSVALFCW